MSELILVIGSVTRRQYQGFRTQLSLAGKRPQIVRMSDEEWLLHGDWQALLDLLERASVEDREILLKGLFPIAASSSYFFDLDNFWSGVKAQDQKLRDPEKVIVEDVFARYFGGKTIAGIVTAKTAWNDIITELWAEQLPDPNMPVHIVKSDGSIEVEAGSLD